MIIMKNKTYVVAEQSVTEKNTSDTAVSMDGIRVLIQPEEMWEYFLQNKEYLKRDMAIVAESDTDDFDKKTFLFVTNEDDTLFLSLEAPGVIMDSEYCYSKEDCIDKFYSLIKQFSEESC